MLGALDLNKSPKSKGVSDKENDTSAHAIMSSQPDAAATQQGDPATTTRTASPDNVATAGFQTLVGMIEKLDQKFDKKFDALEKKVDDGFQRIDTKLDRGFSAVLSGAPAGTAVLSHKKVPIVRHAKEFMKQELTDAILGKYGKGSATWTYLKCTVDDKEEFYLLSSAHCALEYKLLGPDGYQFVIIPNQAKGNIKGVYLLKNGKRNFGQSYRRCWDSDIILLMLNVLPPDVVKDKVLVWNSDVTTNPTEFVGTLVAGNSLKAPVIGRNAVYNQSDKIWWFALESTNEPGQSGTAMLCFDEEDVSKFILENKQESSPRLMGVYYGERELPHDTSLERRGIICPIRPKQDFEFMECCEPPAERVRLLGGKDKPARSWQTQKENSQFNIAGDTLEYKIPHTEDQYWHVDGVFIRIPTQDETEPSTADEVTPEIFPNHGTTCCTIL